MKNYLEEDHRSYRRKFFSCWLESAAPVSQRSRVRIPYKPEFFFFFSGFLFATAKVAYITAMIFLRIIFNSARIFAACLW